MRILHACRGELLVSIAFASATVTNPAVLVASANGITFTQRHYLLRGTTDSLYLHVANQLVGGSPVAMTVGFDVTGDNATGMAQSVFGISGDGQGLGPQRCGRSPTTRAASAPWST